MSRELEIKEILEAKVDKVEDVEAVEDYISYRKFDKVEAAERGLILAKTEKYLRTEVNKFNGSMPKETRKLYNETIKNLRILSDLEHETVKCGE